MAEQVKHTKVSKAKARLLMDHPFFATLLLRTEITLTDDVELAATDGERMYFNPAFLDLLSIEDTMAVMCHEIGHDSLLHSIRLGVRNHELWNMACDHAINLMLEDQGFKCPQAVPGGWLADRKYKGWSADRIYDDIKRNPPPKSGGGHGDQGKPGPGGRRPQNGSGGKPGPAQAGKDWLHGDILPNPKAQQDAAGEAAAVQRAKQKVAAAANMARIAGKLTGDLARLVDDCLEAKVHWTDVLRDYMLKVVKSRETWARRNKRFTRVYLPTRHEKKMGPIVFVPDTSGSMWGDDMEKICSEMAHCASQTQPENITVLWADTEIKGKQVFTADEFEFKLLEPKGGGGTDMRVPLKEAEALEPMVLVLMTDGYTPWPDVPPPYPVITISTTKVEAPFGETIHI